MEVFDNYQKCECCGSKFLLATECQDFIDGEINPWINEELIEGTFCNTCIDRMEKEEI